VKFITPLSIRKLYPTRTSHNNKKRKYIKHLFSKTKNSNQFLIKSNQLLQVLLDEEMKKQKLVEEQEFCIPNKELPAMYMK
jgi:transcription initiation factor IIF auxiliary subunit